MKPPALLDGDTNAVSSNEEVSPKTVTIKVSVANGSRVCKTTIILPKNSPQLVLGIRKYFFNEDDLRTYLNPSSEPATGSTDVDDAPLQPRRPFVDPSGELTPTGYAVGPDGGVSYRQPFQG